MHLIDRSPGMFIAFAAVVVYGVIGVEAWMWTDASVLAIAGTLALIAVTAVLICAATLHLMADASGEDADVDVLQAPAFMPSPEPVAPRTRTAIPPRRAAHVA